MLVEHLLEALAPHVDVLRRGAAARSSGYRWPGNVRELQNVVEQAMWLAERRDDRSGAPAARRAGGGRARCCRSRERRKQVADELYRRARVAAATRSGSTSTRCSSRATSRGTTCASWSCAGCGTTRGNYRSLLRLFGMPASDYKRFLNFLTAHDCNVDYRAFRQGSPEPARTPRVLLPPLRPVVPPAEAEQPPAGEAIDSSR